MDSPRAYVTSALFKFYLVSMVLLALTALVIWFALMIKAAYVPPPRAVTVAAHQSCLDMPRGDQVLEDNRLTCFNELYQGRVRRVITP